MSGSVDASRVEEIPHALHGDDARSETSDREIVNTRVLHAPREQVFRAWIEPEILARWWGPRGFRNTFQEFDPTPGGRWCFVMHAPNGVDFPNESVFEEIVRPERIVSGTCPRSMPSSWWQRSPSRAA